MLNLYTLTLTLDQSKTKLHDRHDIIKILLKVRKYFLLRKSQTSQT